MVCRRRHGGYGLALRAALRQGARATGLRGLRDGRCPPDASGRECGSERIGRSGGSARYPRTRWALARCGRTAPPRGMQHPPVERTRFPIERHIPQPRSTPKGPGEPSRAFRATRFPRAGTGRDSCPPRKLSSPLLPADGCRRRCSSPRRVRAGVWLRTDRPVGQVRAVSPHPLGPRPLRTSRPGGLSARLLEPRLPVECQFPQPRSSVKGPQETPGAPPATRVPRAGKGQDSDLPPKVS